MQEAPYPIWIGLIVALIFIGTPYLMLAVALRKAWGVKGLGGLAVVVIAMIAWVVFTDHSAPHNVQFWSSIVTLLIGFVGAPFVAIEVVGRAPSPPSFWKQVGIGFAAMLAALIACFLIGALVIVGAVFLQAHHK